MPDLNIDGHWELSNIFDNVVMTTPLIPIEEGAVGAGVAVGRVRVGSGVLTAIGSRKI